jgi:hypothetical protein
MHTARRNKEENPNTLCRHDASRPPAPRHGRSRWGGVGARARALQSAWVGWIRHRAPMPPAPRPARAAHRLHHVRLTFPAQRLWRNVFGRNRGERALDQLRTTRSLPLCSVRPRRRPRAPRRAPPCPSPPLLTLTLSHTIYACMGPAQAVRGCRRRGRVWTGGGNRGTLDSPENP